MSPKVIEVIALRCKVDPILDVLMSRLAGRTHKPSSTKEASIRHFAQAKGVDTSRKAVRLVVLFLTGLGVGEFFQDPERRESKIVWNVDAMSMARKVQGWTFDDELRAFMESIPS